MPTRLTTHHRATSLKRQRGPCFLAWRYTLDAPSAVNAAPEPSSARAVASSLSAKPDPVDRPRVPRQAAQNMPEAKSGENSLRLKSSAKW